MLATHRPHQRTLRPLPTRGTRVTVHDRSTFNPEALYVALDRARRERRTTWRGITREAGIRSVNLGTSLGQGKHVSADVLCRLLLWLGTTDLAPYITTDPEGPTT